MKLLIRPDDRGPHRLLCDSLCEVSVLVLVFGVLDGIKGIHALAIAVAAFVVAVLLERYR